MHVHVRMCVARLCVMCECDAVYLWPSEAMRNIKVALEIIIKIDHVMAAWRFFDNIKSCIEYVFRIRLCTLYRNLFA